MNGGVQERAPGSKPNVVDLRKFSILNAVTPAKAGVQKDLKRLDSGLRDCVAITFQLHEVGKSTHYRFKF
jgi:hypothetical protein